MKLSAVRKHIVCILTFTATITSFGLFSVSSSANTASSNDFKTPTGNIHCGSYDINNQKFLRCDIVKNLAKIPKQPKDCNLDWGNALIMDTIGKASRLCHGDTAINPTNPVLGYGKIWKKNGFICISKTTGLTCLNQNRKGWEISKTQQKFI
ncbi:MAG: DUF6636 domain-containing protein [Rivularia sp. (in: cyanobacteria)]